MKKPDSISSKTSEKVKKNRWNQVAVAVGLISFCVLFFGFLLVHEDNETSFNDLPAVSTSTQVSEEITAPSSEMTESTVPVTTSSSTEETTSEISSTASDSVDAVITDESEAVTSIVSTSDSATQYILNTNTKKFHYPDCRHVSSIKDENRVEYTGSREDLIAEGYLPCGTCNP